MLDTDEEQNELIQEFLVECYEGLDKLDQDLLTLEEDPRNTEILSGIFRTFHTIKGTAGFLAFRKLESVAHQAENLLSKLRDGALVMNTGRADALLKTVDTLRAILASIESSRSEGDEDCTELLDNLKRLQQPDQDGFLSSGVAPATATAEATNEASEASATRTTAEASEPTPTSEPEAGLGHSPETTAAAPPAIVPSPASLPDAVAAARAARWASPPPSLAAAQAAAAGGAASAAGADEDEGAEAAPSVGKASGNKKKEGSEASVATSTAPAKSSKPNAVDTSIRVDVNLLDSIMNLVGELVLTRNQIVQHTATDPSSALAATSQRLNLITSDLQEGVMKTRMQPIRNVWSKFPRVVRDLTTACGKRASLVMEGEETELDRTILEAIKDPLTHMVRNSVDHGIESVEERVAAGKPAEGTLKLRAYHEGGQVNLELIDDGRGIDIDRVKEKAVERGLLTRDKAGRMSEREALQLIFLPGFSTAQKVTNVSGRGVGMDVVRTNIEKIGGTVDIQSAKGEGTTLRIKIPLTLAIIPALLVTVDGCRFAIPQVSLIELVRLEGERARDAIEEVHGTPVYRLRGELLPLVDLRKELGLRPRPEIDHAGASAPMSAGTGVPAGSSEGEASVSETSLNIVVLQADDRQYGLIVDSVNDTEEIVVKPLSQQIRDIPVYAGATILGDGRVALILDSIGIAKRAHVLDEQHGHKQAREEAPVVTDAPIRGGQVETLLLLDLDENRAAIPLSSVARLEEIPVAEVEQSGDFLVTQYRDRIMPLVWLGRTKGRPVSRAAESDERLQVIVHASGEQHVGLVVDRIHDIVDASIVIERTTNRADTLGSAVVQGRVTDLLDIAGIVHRAIPNLARATAPRGEGARA
ncbi:MAG: chemotaxis protein CheW [Myxococcota bacterium]